MLPIKAVVLVQNYNSRILGSSRATGHRLSCAVPTSTTIFLRSFCLCRILPIQVPGRLYHTIISATRFRNRASINLRRCSIPSELKPSPPTFQMIPEFGALRAIARISSARDQRKTFQISRFALFSKPRLFAAEYDEQCLYLKRAARLPQRGNHKCPNISITQRTASKKTREISAALCG